ncbi:CpsD/CapB family tyrosine-protein kinase [Natranaerobius thermophilus]|uniref:Capsular polysaccharide biosynthesis protein n=1 Tax=Natranaerobius thermophilus (strain ATCC BAA-1301 / DSM 18059 / JW/NM-WN-LF) TaxID=457570 RepID=B2A853_NATTJ|nr:CpsD/CapB family tyrosine-protein kinase [Natranaerobius thermophilus]ACB85821.1 capsular polysaccharide biosynthesis protein [Natranaerobius thermophilus JW/NM-WN-LF]
MKTPSDFPFSNEKKKTNLELYRIKQNLKSVMVTSSEDNTGKSTVAAKLAINDCRNDRKILLIDCDFQEPSQHSLFGVQDNPGFFDVIDNSSLQLSKVIQRPESFMDKPVDFLDTDYPDILTIGSLPKYPLDQLNSQSGQALLQQLSQKYHTIVIDAPCVYEETDLSTFASYLEGIVLVVSSQEASSNSEDDESKEDDTQNQLDKLQGKVLGVVFN